MSTSLPTVNVVRSIRQWFEPHWTSEDEAFRELTLRILIAFIVPTAGVFFVVNRVFYRDIGAWALISYPSMILAAFLLSSAAGIAVHVGRLQLAGWIQVSAFMLFGTALILIEGVSSVLALPLYMLTVFLASIVLTRQNITLIAALCVALYGFAIIVAPVPVSSALVPLYLIDVMAVIAIEATFLYQQRSIMDRRLARMQKLYVEAESARKEADAANKVKSQFLANMSHELRTPLNAVIAYGEIMLNFTDKPVGALNGEQRDLIGRIVDNGKRLLGMINEVLDLARLEAGRIQIVPVPMAPATVVEKEVANLRSLADKKGIYLKTVAQNAPESVVCDPDKFRQILVNLVSNAVKFTDVQGVTVTVSADGVDHWKCSVQDTGIGMPKDAVGRIFDAFIQVDSTDNRKYEGTGLGLAITKRFVDGMNGKITVETEPGKGSTFTVILPCVVEASTIQLREKL